MFAPKFSKALYTNKTLIDTGRLKLPGSLDFFRRSFFNNDNVSILHLYISLFNIALILLKSLNC